MSDPDDIYWTDPGLLSGQVSPDFPRSGAVDTSLRLLSLSFTVSSVSLAALAVLSLISALASDCKEEGSDAKKLPLAVSVFVAFIAFGAWKLRRQIMEGFSILEILPEFYRKAGPAGLPPEVAQWKSLTWKWLLCFCLIIWGGIIVIDLYCVAPLAEKCNKEPPPPLIAYLAKARSAIVFFLLLITIAPLLMGLLQIRKWTAPYNKAQKLLEGNGSGVFTSQGATDLFDDTFAMGELVDYTGQGHHEPDVVRTSPPYNARISSGAL